VSNTEHNNRKTGQGISALTAEALIRMRIGLRHFFRELTPRIRWALVALSSIFIVASIVLFVLGRVSSSSVNTEVPKSEIAKKASDRLQSIVQTLSNLRDSLGTDSLFTIELENEASTALRFETIFHLDSLWDNKFTEILPLTSKNKYEIVKARGIAYYDPEKHLTAWNSTKIGTANFDSTFSYSSLLEKHSKSIFIENEQIFSWVIAIRKIISKSGALQGYITAKAIIGERFPVAGSEERPLSIFDDIFAESGRDIRFFSKLEHVDSSLSKDIFALYVDPTDSSSVAGYLMIGTAVEKKERPLHKIIYIIRDIAFVIFVLFFFWIVCWFITNNGIKNKSSLGKFYALCRLLFILCVERILLLITESPSSFIPQSLQDSQDFALPFGYGILSNPLQVFITLLFVATLFALSWVILVPEKADWHNTPKEEATPDNEAIKFSTLGWLLKIIVIFGLMLLLPAINYLFATVVSSLVTNGSYHYLGNKFGFSKGSFVLMEAVFLLLGISYFFSALLVLLSTLRAMIKMTASELSPSRTYYGHYIFFILLTTLWTWLLSPVTSLPYNEIYWAILCFILCSVTIVIFVRDLALLRLAQKGPSLFYRIPRSGLAILFMLSAAGFILSPLIASNEHSNDVDIIKQNLRQNSQANDLSYSSFLDQTFLLFCGDEGMPISIPLEGEQEIKNYAFNIWLKYFSETANRNVVIELNDFHGKVLSHFSQNATLEDEGRLTRTKDSLMTLLVSPTSNHHSARETQYLTGTEPCFTASCTPATVGVGILNLTIPKRHHIGNSDSAAGFKLLLSIAVWNDPFHKAQMHSLYEIVHPANASADKLSWQDQDVIYGQYQNGSLLNSSSSFVELRPHISGDISKKLQKSEFASSEESVEGSKNIVIYHAMGDSSNSNNRLIAATIAVPELKALTELTLSLNTVSLFVGFFVILFALVLRSLFSEGKSATLKFRDRIFLIVLTIALVPLVIVTNITRSLLIEREQRVEREHLQRDADIVAERLQRSITPSDSGRTKLEGILGDLSHTIGRDISLYNQHGILQATNRPELYESSLLANQLSSQTVSEMLIRQKSFTIEPLASASGSFDIGYKAIHKSGSDALIGIIGVTSFRGMQIIEADIAQTIELMYGAFAALGIILLLIGAWISVRVAAPIQQLIAATERVTEGRLETFVNIKRKDEVGELAQAFNRMTTELERSKENVAQSEREGAWKEMARQVAHEIKNPLTPMKLSVQHVEHAYESGDTNFGSVFKRVIRTLSEQIDVLTRIATEFSRFGEMPRRRYGFVSLKKVVESAVALYDAERGRIRFVIDIPNNLPFIYADDESFRRALVNLLRNSLQATEGWGVILISAHEKNGLIHLKISDTGGGMSEETLRKAFDPNFSTKTSGMGLGLAIVKKIITEMSGTISVESSLGKGTTFHIDLPARNDRENNELI